MVGTTSIREGGHFFQRCLGHSSCSTLGLLLLLSNWAFADCKAKGALTRGGSTMCSSELVGFFTTVFAVQGAKRTCTVYAVSGVLPLHPRPVCSAASQPYSLLWIRVESCEKVRSPPQACLKNQPLSNS